MQIDIDQIDTNSNFAVISNKNKLKTILLVILLNYFS
jgi:hypothetical protein